MLNDIAQILPSHRVNFYGKTGSGKTVLAKTLLDTVGNAIVVDTKNTINWHRREPQRWRLISNPQHLINAGLKRLVDNVVFRPPGTWEREDFDKLALWTLKRRHTLLYFDELQDIGDEHSKPSSGMGQLARKGREISASLWAAMQRPSRVPGYIISEAEHHFIFFLQQPGDVKRIQEVTGYDIDPSTLEQYEFFYIMAQKRNQLSRPLRLSLNGRNRS